MLDENRLSFSFFGRRMLILFLIGVLHIILLWSGDVLNLYAILGLFTTLIIKWPNKLILILSGVFLFFPFYNQVFEFLFSLINFQPEVYLKEYTGAMVNKIIKHGTYLFQTFSSIFFRDCWQ